MKKFIFGFVVGVTIGLTSTALASLNFSIAGSPLLTPLQEIEMGHKYSVYTGKILEVEQIPKEEARLRSIEDRLSKLELKIK